MNKHRPKVNIQSSFKTTRENELVILMSSMIIYPSFVVSVHHIINLVNTLSWSFTGVLKAGFWSLCVVPMFIHFVLSENWNIKSRNKKRCYLVSLTYLIVFLCKDFWQTFYLLILVECILFFIFIIKRYFARIKFKSNVQGIMSIVLASFIALFFVLIVMWSWTYGFQDYFALLNVGKMRFWIIRWVILVLAIRFSFDLMELIKKSLILGVPEFSIKEAVKLFKLIVYFMLFYCGYVAVSYALVYSNNFFLSAILFLAFLLITYDPSLFFSQNVASFRFLIHSYRRSYIYKLISPSNLSQINILSFINRLALFWKNHSATGTIIFIWLIFGLAMPVYLYSENQNVEIIPNLVSVALITSVSITILFSIFQILVSQPKHIVLPFVALGVDDKVTDVDAKKIATLAEHALVDHLKELYVLLSMRQVENLSLRNDNGLPVFVTSGQDREIFGQFQSLGEIDAGAMKLSIGKIFLPVITMMARTKVHGIVQRQNDNSMTIWIEYVERGGRTVAVDMALLTEDLIKDIDKDLIKEHTYGLAVKLIFKLGYHSYLASSCESLQHFLEGLNSAHYRKWWSAISHYQDAIQIEDANSATFSYGYYHLGAMLLFQGEIAQGLKYLKIAEVDGPPLAENNYMIALGLFYQYRDELHVNRSISDDIKWRCETAINQRPDFPEVYHLLGTFYYQRGRLRERIYTNNETYDSDDTVVCDPISRHYKIDYFFAEKNFRRSIKYYDKVIKKNPKDMIAKFTIFDENARLVKDRLSATHRLGDVLRSLDKFSEAKSYYDEVRFAFPRNNRTLIDIAKTYCFSSNWEQADNFIRMTILTHSELTYDKSVNFYIGWAILGGIAAMFSLKKRALNLLIDSYSFLNSSLSNVENSIDQGLVIEAINALEYSYHQYPNYIHRWSQMDWIPLFKKAVYVLGLSNFGNDEDIIKFYKQVIYKNQFPLKLALLWMAWRIISKNIFSDSEMDHMVTHIAVKSNISDEVPQKDMEIHYQKFKEFQKKYYKCIYENDNLFRMDAESIKDNIAKLVDDVFPIWHKVCKTVKSAIMKCYVKGAEGKPQFSLIFKVRWAIDVFLDMSLFLCKLLVEANAYEYAENVTNDCIQIITEMKLTHNEQMDILGEKVFSFQIATLYAWKAYSILKRYEDPDTQTRLDMKKWDFINDINLIQACLDKSRECVSHHRLTIFTQAILNYHNGNLDQASNDFKLLMTIISPIDPHKYIAEDYISNNDDIGYIFNEEKDLSDYSGKLSALEYINGRRQFDFIVNLETIYFYLAKVFRKNGDLNLAAEHVNNAIANCISNERRSELFIYLTQLLIDQGNYSDSLITLNEAKMRYYKFPNSDKTDVSKFDVLYLSIMDQMGKSSQSFDQTKLMVDSYDINNLRNAIKKVAKQYNCDKEEFYSKCDLEGFLQNTDKELAPLENEEVFTLAGNYFQAAPNLYQQVVDDAISPYEYKLFKEKQIYSRFTRQAVDFLINYCDLRNNYAKISAEISTDMRFAKEGIQKAIETLEHLLKQISPYYKADNDEVTSISFLEYENTFSLSHQVLHHLRHKLADYYDTYAWLNFRENYYYEKALSVFDEPYNTIRDNALILNPNSALYYYHLAKISIQKHEYQDSIMRLEGRGQLQKEKNILQAKYSLRLALRHWRQATSLDRNKQYYSHLRRLYDQIAERMRKFKMDPNEKSA